jgi:hypothetical protein
MNGQITIFEVDYFAFGTIPTQRTMCSWHPPIQKAKMKECFKPRFVKKAWIIPHKKWYFLLNTHFLVKEIINITSNFK